MQSAKSPIFIISPFSNPLDRSNERIESEKEIFSHEAIFKIFSFSKCCPRLINTICNRALLTGYAQDISQLDHEVIQKCADELALHGEENIIWKSPPRREKRKITVLEIAKSIIDDSSKGEIANVSKR